MTTDNVLQALREKASSNGFEPSTPWTPEVGEELFGKLEGVVDVNTKIGVTKVARIRKDDGALVAVFLTRSVLRSKFEALNATPGDTLYFRYDGARQSEQGRTYHAYALSSL